MIPIGYRLLSVPLSGPLGVLAAFVLASMIVGFIFLKPLGVQI